MRAQLTRKLRLAAATALLISVAAFAADSTLRVTATLVGSVLLTVQSGESTTSGAGEATLSCAIGNVASMQAGFAGFALTRSGKQWKLSSTIQSSAVKANMTNTSYGLTARLQRPLPTGVAWRVNGVELSNAKAVTITSAEFGTNSSLSWEIVIDDSATAVPLDDVIVFTVVPK